MIIELHAIQTFAPSNLNRDDTGNPKEALFGGVRRARISSQAAKRAMRVSDVFKDAVRVSTGIRTKKLVRHIADKMEREGFDRVWVEEQALAIAGDLFAKMDRRAEQETSVLLYISDDEIDKITQCLRDALEASTEPDIKDFNKGMVKQFANRTSAPDIALFGRMLAEKPALNVDAACQVAHAISTHEVNTAEFDYFTAVDDFTPEDTSGAGMLGLVPFNSATYYRCARIDWQQLVKNLGDDADLARQTVGAFMRAFALVVPTGMQNSFINKHQPDFLLAAARPNNDGQSLANAFEKPVRNERASGNAEPSIKALCQYWSQVEAAFRLAEPTLAVLNPREHTHCSQELADATVANLRDWIGVMTAELGEG
jgi:CRISPR system Cascade subunit CasC